MSDRIVVDVIETEDGRGPDYEGGFEQARYWDDGNNAERFGLDESEVSIVPL